MLFLLPLNLQFVNLQPASSLTLHGNRQQRKFYVLSITKRTTEKDLFNTLLPKPPPSLTTLYYLLTILKPHPSCTF